MYLQDLDLKEIDYNSFKSEILETYETEEDLKENEIEELLADNYYKAANAVSSLYYEVPEKMATERSKSFSIIKAGKNLWRRLRAFLCKVLNAGSSAQEVLEKIIEFLAPYLPGGIIFKKAVKAILRFFLKRGYTALCPVN
ncbi:hypothetical protein [Flavobacterium litorale]|uniref:Uncharacterized protein n=1 Tax=Flavobacterium litorale TaxID=2856519 RepID=A0ABX8V711_9FLAO|nr:hypothetical protein [Flavobacterium litorale]QYJ68615.1 hypothetical protein K1I41_01680 [Flavobacterium litorale]